MEQHNVSASERAFEIPELATLICSFADRQDCQRHLPIKIDTSRLEFYIPFVESLEVSRLLTKKYRIQESWRTHPAHAQRIIQFPKLRRLAYTGLSEFEDDQLDYLILALCPSVREIEISSGGDGTLWQSLSSASRLLTFISQNCPDLERLRIYPGERDFDAAPNGRFYAYIFTKGASPLHEGLGRLRGLRSLVISPAALQPEVLRTIGALPYLESLTVQSTAYGGPVYDDYDLDDASFPALRTLELVDLDPHTMENLCELEPLLHRLERASISYGTGFDRETWDFDGDRVESLYTLVESSPKLTNLKFDTGVFGNEILMIPELINLFQSRAIRHLDLSTLDNRTEPIGWSELFSALPLVEELLLYNTIGCLELRRFATTLPRLQFLALSEIEFGGIDTSAGSSAFEGVPNPSRAPLRIQSEFSDVYDIAGQFNTVARYLHALWPNVAVEAKSRKDSNSARLHIKITRHINRALSRLRRSSA
ncbi:hypothetical protein FRC07_000021 [Ceratobasidium sp. 392]|nr:hypothetical protein FRC07_000021 [Ceratobasidium sp. 392]